VDVDAEANMLLPAAQILYTCKIRAKTTICVHSVTGKLPSFVSKHKFLTYMFLMRELCCAQRMSHVFANTNHSDVPAWKIEGDA